VQRKKDKEHVRGILDRVAQLFRDDIERKPIRVAEHDGCPYKLLKETEPKQKERKDAKLPQIGQSILKIRRSALGWREPLQGAQPTENTGKGDNRIERNDDEESSEEPGEGG